MIRASVDGEFDLLLVAGRTVEKLDCKRLAANDLGFSLF
jgi:hypothetical protein